MEDEDMEDDKEDDMEDDIEDDMEDKMEDDDDDDMDDINDEEEDTSTSNPTKNNPNKETRPKTRSITSIQPYFPTYVSIHTRWIEGSNSYAYDNFSMIIHHWSERTLICLFPKEYPPYIKKSDWDTFHSIN